MRDCDKKHPKAQEAARMCIKIVDAISVKNHIAGSMQSEIIWKIEQYFSMEESP